MDLGFRLVFQISLNPGSVLLPCDGENCELLSSDCLRNVLRKELSVSPSHKDAG